MMRKKSSSETRLPPGSGKRLPGLSASDEKPTYKIRTTTKTLKRARQLRTQLTDAEMRLWMYLRRRQLNGAYFRKQCPIGPYIADFACLEAKLIIELDGGQHADSTADKIRDAWFTTHGYRTFALLEHRRPPKHGRRLFDHHRGLGPIGEHPACPSALT
ncbi:MAG TPA: DUF559 domain-containing protein [Dongiaceae bacterium]|nr:DUF559 domain-containing protein [Dongiaceae bacterium]